MFCCRRRQNSQNIKQPRNNKLSLFLATKSCLDKITCCIFKINLMLVSLVLRRMSEIGCVTLTHEMTGISCFKTTPLVVSN